MCVTDAPGDIECVTLVPQRLVFNHASSICPYSICHISFGATNAPYSPSTLLSMEFLSLLVSLGKNDSPIYFISSGGISTHFPSTALRRMPFSTARDVQLN